MGPVSVWEDEKVLEMDGGDGATIHETIRFKMVN